MYSFTLSQACSEGRGGAARTLSFRAAIPFIGTASSNDLLTYIAISVFIIIIIAIVHREITKSRTREHSHAHDIQKDRDNLERRIAERTKELITAETERLNELNRAVQFGELSRGLFHDLLSPISSVSLYLEKLGARTQESREANEIVEKVVGISKRMNSYMESVRRCLGNTAEISNEVQAELNEELGIIRDILGYKARTAGVDLQIAPSKTLYLPIHPVRLHQLLLNLISNAIEACGNSGIVEVHAEKIASVITITVKDSGHGMTNDQVNSILDGSFTTKGSGHGLGLTTVKNIVEEDLKGKLSIQSEPGKGSVFTVTVTS